MASRIKRNAIVCNHCGTEIESTHGLDYRKCECGKVAVHGGNWYLRRIGEPGDYTDVSVVDDVEAAV